MAIARRELDRRAAEVELCRRSLADFLRAAWQVLEPSTPLVWGWNLDAVCEHLEAVTRGEIKNLVVSVPPGTTKSIVASVVWPVWSWLNEPGLRFLTSANRTDLATDFAIASRRLIESDWFRDRFGDLFALTSDQNAKGKYDNDKRGRRQAVGVDGKITGSKSDILMMDDADDARKVHSEKARKAVHNYWDRSFYNRVNDHATGRRVVIAQRLHPDDLTGHILKAGGFEQLRIPEQFDPRRRYTTSIGWTDPRAAAGEWLRPGRFGPEEKAQAVVRLGVAGYKAQHDQEPEAAEGALYKEAWLGRRWRWSADANGNRLVVLGEREFLLPAVWLTVDAAASAKTTADCTAISAWAASPWGDLVWLDCDRSRYDIPDQPPAVERMIAKWGARAVGIEQASGGQYTIQELTRRGVPVIPLVPTAKTGDKVARAVPAITLAEAGRVWLPAAGASPGFPIDAVLAELLTFTGKDGGADDIADTLSWAADPMLKRFAGGGGIEFLAKPAGGGGGGTLPAPDFPGGDWAAAKGVFGVGAGGPRLGPDLGR